MKMISRFAAAATLSASVSMTALATDYYEPEPLPETGTEQTVNNNIHVTPEQIQDMSNQQLIDFVNENHLTSQQVSQLQSHMTNDQNVALNNAIETGDVNVATGDVTTSLTVGDLSATADAYNAGNTNNISSNTKVQGSYSIHPVTPIVATPAGNCNSGFSAGVAGGTYGGNGSVGLGWQNSEDQECAEAAHQRIMERQEQMNKHGADMQDDAQAHQVMMTAHEHNCDRSPKKTVKQLANGTVVTTTSNEEGPADKAEHILCHTNAAEHSDEYKKSLATTYTKIAQKTNNGAKPMGDSMTILMGIADSYSVEIGLDQEAKRVADLKGCLAEVQTKSEDEEEYNVSIGTQVCHEKYPALKR